MYNFRDDDDQFGFDAQTKRMDDILFKSPYYRQQKKKAMELLSSPMMRFFGKITPFMINTWFRFVIFIIAISPLRHWSLPIIGAVYVITSIFIPNIYLLAITQAMVVIIGFIAALFGPQDIITVGYYIFYFIWLVLFVVHMTFLRLIKKYEF